jgi:hypothetical protein
MQSVSYHDLEFEQTPVEKLTSLGSPYTKWIDTGMPVVPAKFLDTVFFLYKSESDAKAGKNAGGTGFFVALPTDDGLGHHYGISNWHVAVRGGFSVIRMNTANGGTEIIPLQPDDWEFIPGKDDVAVAPLSLREPHQIALFIGSNVFHAEEKMITPAIGPGDDVFMIGRFVDIDHTESNVPALRFGNISTVPIPITQPTPNKYRGLSYCVDMHSRSGFSGSPVFIYRTSGHSIEFALTNPPPRAGSLFNLLGIHWGQFPEEMPIKKKKKTMAESKGAVIHEYVEGLSGMTCVIPAARIMDVLNCKKFLKQRETEEARRKKSAPPPATEPIAESSGNTEAGDAILRQMLNTPPEPHSKAKATTKAKKR